MITSIKTELIQLSNPTDAHFLQKYFKTAPGQYGAGDLFRGIRVPMLRKVAKGHKDLTLAQAGELLRSEYHEDRLVALLILVGRFAKADEAGRSTIYELYLGSTRHINNWDLVDVSAGPIVGRFLCDKDHAPLDLLALSPSLWERRIAIMATSHYIGKMSFGTTLRIAKTLLTDKEDLIHKAVGWMLREVGKRDLACEEAFLMAHYRQMPRTMLRYAIEKFPEEKRLGYLKGTVTE